MASEVICNGGVGAPNHRGAHVTNAECDVSNPIIRSMRYDINLSIHADVRHVGGNLLIGGTRWGWGSFSWSQAWCAIPSSSR